MCFLSPIKDSSVTKQATFMNYNLYRVEYFKHETIEKQTFKVKFVTFK